jgi:phage gpG-like protein
MTDISLTVEDRQVLDVLRQITERFTPAGMRPAMKEIGETLAASTKRRFATSTAPDGSPWKPLAQGTVLARLQKITDAYYAQNKRNVDAKKAGKFNPKGANAVMSMKPLIDTGGLQRSIHYQITDGGAGVAIGTNRFAGEWEGGAAMHQFGSRDGRLPARPFLGLSLQDKRTVLVVLNELLHGAIR